MLPLHLFLVPSGSPLKFITTHESLPGAGAAVSGVLSWPRQTPHAALLKWVMTAMTRLLHDNGPWFPFRSLPSELRLRVLQHTHLGPPDTGNYDPCFERLLIRGGKLEPGIHHFPWRTSISEWAVQPRGHRNLFLLLRSPENLTIMLLVAAAPLPLPTPLHVSPALRAIGAAPCPQHFFSSTAKCTRKQPSRSSIPMPTSTFTRTTSAESPGTDSTHQVHHDPRAV